jgi:hypothetical protein
VAQLCLVRSCVLKISDIRAKAVLLGLLTDIGGSICVGLVLGVVIGIVAAISGDVSPGHIAALRQNFALKLTGLFGTTLFTALGGYVAARIARATPLANSLAVGIVSLLLAITLVAVFPGVSPPWKIIAGCIITIPAALLGGYFAARPKKN